MVSRKAKMSDVNVSSDYLANKTRVFNTSLKNFKIVRKKNVTSLFLF